MTAITEAVQSSTPGALVELFTLDLTRFGDQVYRFTKNTDGQNPVLWGGQPFFPVPIEAEGWEYSGTGPIAQPTIRVGDGNLSITALIVSFGDCAGAVLTRYKTLGRFLDGGSDADPNALLQRDVFNIDRLSKHRPNHFAEWTLAAAVDQQGRLLPGRQALRSCQHRYRSWNPAIGGYDYSTATCPYAGGAAYNERRQGVPANQDRCGKRQGDCILRFGRGAWLPFDGFPGLARARF